MASDDSIRSLLAAIPPQPFIWCDKGCVVIMEDKIIDAGGDLAAVLAWVESVGGHEDRTIPVAGTRRGTTAVPKPVGRRYYVVPELALSGDVAA
ncbi:hypothetical protein BH20ACT16_BH20ACT16_05520 [soil metagenome]